MDQERERERTYIIKNSFLKERRKDGEREKFRRKLEISKVQWNSWNKCINRILYTKITSIFVIFIYLWYLIILSFIYLSHLMRELLYSSTLLKIMKLIVKRRHHKDCHWVRTTEWSSVFFYHHGVWKNKQNCHECRMRREKINGQRDYGSLLNPRGHFVYLAPRIIEAFTTHCVTRIPV